MTAQIRERLILNGEQTSMACCPEVPYWHNRIERKKDRVLDIDGEQILIPLDSACWRGYQGTWEIRDDHFYLVDLEGGYRLDPGEPVFADWYSGILKIPRGELLDYVHLGFASIYEQELLVTVNLGHVTASCLVSNRARPRGIQEASSADQLNGNTNI